MCPDVTLINPSFSSLRQSMRASNLLTFSLNAISRWGMPLVPEDSTALQEKKDKRLQLTQHSSVQLITSKTNNFL